MFDTLAVAQQLAAGGVDRDQAEVIAELRTEQRTGIANLETRLARWMVGTVIATATLTVGILLLIG